MHTVCECGCASIYVLICKGHFTIEIYTTCEGCCWPQNIQIDASACKSFCMHVILDHSAFVCVRCLARRLNLPFSIKKPPDLLCSAWCWIKPGLHIWSCWVTYLKYTSLVVVCPWLYKPWPMVDLNLVHRKMMWARPEIVPSEQIILCPRSRQRINKESVFVLCIYFAEWRTIRKALEQKYA